MNKSFLHAAIALGLAASAAGQTTLQLEVTTGQGPVAHVVAGAIVVARAAGCLVETLEGATLDVPLDATTPVGFVGWANAATAARLRPHLQAALSPS